MMPSSFIIEPLLNITMRTIIDLDEARLRGLDAWAASAHISRAEAVRRAVDALLQRVAQPKGQGFGLWAQNGPVPPERDGLRLQQDLRNEWPD